MNVITITGNIGNDCESKFLPDGTPFASFSVADSQGRDKQSIWWRCGLYGKRAESLAPYLTKGQQVTVIGSVSQRDWTDKDGNKRTSMDVRVNDIALQGGKRDAEPAQAAKKPAKGGAPSPSFADMDDDIPFAPISRKALYAI